MARRSIIKINQHQSITTFEMKKFKQNKFAEKFRLLNSQESGAEINWSSSESSDCETVQSINKLCESNKKKNYNRKRKSKVHKNISNLDIAILDVTKETKDVCNRDIPASPSDTKENFNIAASPILGSSQFFPPFMCKESPKSPIITSKLLDLPCNNMSLKSPILILKRVSTTSHKVRKKLFEVEDVNKCPTMIINHDQIELRNTSNQHSLAGDKSCDNNYLLSEDSILQTFSNHIKKTVNGPNPETNCTILETPEILDDSLAMIKTTSLDLARKVKSYFDSHFSSENASQQSISDAPTPKNSSKSSEDVEIISIISQPASRGSTDSLKEQIIDNKKDKKFRYRKDGLSQRLNKLIKKQTASISLWKHERFLAANSNFVIPKGEFIAFRIENSCFKYGIFLLDAMDCNDENFLILINSVFEANESDFTGCVLKLYEPYKVLDYKDDCKLIINVSKYECVTMKS